MTTEGRGNVTYLFCQPEKEGRENGLHSSESFWTSIFALYILIASDLRKPTQIPTYKFIKDDKDNWKYIRNKEFLNVPIGLKYDDLIIEGKINKFMKRIGIPDEAITAEYWDKKPDIIIKKDNQISIIEVKTIGSPLLKDSVEFYIKLKNLIKIKSEYNVELYFLYSLGNNEAEKYLNNNDPPFKIILWEHVLKAIDLDTGELRRAFSGGKKLSYYYNNLKLKGHKSG
jgi:hypothetical protein